MSPARRVSAGGMTLKWRVDGDTLIGVMTAPTAGWVLAGFNRTKRLYGARLIMGRVRDGRVEVEEHVADPPRHHRRATLERVSGSQSATSTTIHFEMPLEGLVAGEETHIILAYSASDDFFHHSRFREHVDHAL